MRQESSQTGQAPHESTTDRFLRDASERANGDEAVLTIREFISRWGARRRGYWIVEQIKEDLNRFGLTTKPDFEEGYIDSEIRLIPPPRAKSVTSAATAASVAVDAKIPEATLKIGSFKSASDKLVSVRPDSSLEHAQSVMMQHDYSQLAVLSSPRDLLGAITWESIAQRRIHRPAATLRECIVPADVVDTSDDLLYNIPRIIARGFVFVRGPDRQITGIVTTTDLSLNFLTLAEPFLILGQVERCLRQIVMKRFTVDEIAEAKDPRDEGRKVDSVDNLTLGEVVRMFEPVERWQKLGWQIDRKVFLEALAQVVEMRNETMHFSPDPVEEERVQGLRNSLKWLQMMV
jgi:CBS domain-containing protein